jgi:hypothetical protein
MREMRDNGKLGGKNENVAKTFDDAKQHNLGMLTESSFFPHLFLTTGDGTF